jgi:hypothetical protein
MKSARTDFDLASILKIPMFVGEIPSNCGWTGHPAPVGNNWIPYKTL